MTEQRIIVSAGVHIISKESEFLDAIGKAISEATPQGSHQSPSKCPVIRTLVNDLSSAEESIRSQDDSLLIWDASGDLCNADIISKVAERDQSIVVIDGEADDLIRLWDEHPSLNHIWTRKGGRITVAGRYIAKTLSRLRCDETTQGITSYLGQDAEIYKVEIREYRKTKDCVERVRDLAALGGGFEHLPVMVASLTWEMIMNAMFDAPFDFGKMEPKYSHLPRTNDLVLNESEKIILEYGYDDEVMAISVRDCFGMLTKDTVIKSLIRSSKQDQFQVKRGGAGAGVGLYMLLDSVNQLDFQVKSRQFTEVIVVIRLSRRFRDFEFAGKAVNFF